MSDFERLNAELREVATHGRPYGISFKAWMRNNVICSIDEGSAPEPQEYVCLGGHHAVQGKEAPGETGPKG